MNEQIRKLRARLTQEQADAAELLARNNFLPKAKDDMDAGALKQAKDNGDVRLNLEDIAEKVGVSTRQFYRWRNHNDDFINYVNALSTTVFKSHMPDVMRKHLDMTVKGQGSMKGIELFYKFFGLLVDKQEVKTEGNVNQSVEERLEALKSRGKSVINDTDAKEE